MTKSEKLALVWRHTHRDFKGKVEGARCVLVHRPGVGTCLVELDKLEEAELERRLAHALKMEAAR